MDSIEPIIASPHSIYPSRRSFLKRTGSGFGLVALTAMLDQQKLLAATVSNPLAARPAHFSAKAKNVIWRLRGDPTRM